MKYGKEYGSSRYWRYGKSPSLLLQCVLEGWWNYSYSYYSGWRKKLISKEIRSYTVYSNCVPSRSPPHPSPALTCRNWWNKNKDKTESSMKHFESPLALFGLSHFYIRLMTNISLVLIGSIKKNNIPIFHDLDLHPLLTLLIQRYYKWWSNEYRTL